MTWPEAIVATTGIIGFSAFVCMFLYFMGKGL